jgi:hypothetical protein
MIRKIFSMAVIILLLAQVIVFVFLLFNRQSILAPTNPPERMSQLPETADLAKGEELQSISATETHDTHQDFVEKKATIPWLEDLPESVQLAVPFTPQAPFGNWADPRQDYGCEEASLLMASHWLTGQSLTAEYSLEQITTIADWQLEHYGDFHDSSAADSAKIFVEYFGHNQPDIVYDITPADIRVQLALGNLVIAPVNGIVLDNPYFTPPGPGQHMVVITGYDDRTGEFITNDPGTKRGENLRYTYENFGAALRDYATGHGEPLLDNRTAMIVINANSSQPAFSDQLIKLPLALHLVTDTNNRFTTTRDFENLSQVVVQVNDIWRQAHIQFEIESIDMAPVASASDWSPDQLAARLATGPNYKDGVTNAYFVRQIAANGIAFYDFQSLLVADYTSVNDFRATAHEIGHLLGLSHVFDSRGKLMYQGVNGTLLSPEEISRARQAALDLIE